MRALNVLLIAAIIIILGSFESVASKSAIVAASNRKTIVFKQDTGFIKDCFKREFDTNLIWTKLRIEKKGLKRYLVCTGYNDSSYCLARVVLKKKGKDLLITSKSEMESCTSTNPDCLLVFGKKRGCFCEGIPSDKCLKGVSHRLTLGIIPFRRGMGMLFN